MSKDFSKGYPIDWIYLICGLVLPVPEALLSVLCLHHPHEDPLFHISHVQFQLVRILFLARRNGLSRLLLGSAFPPLLSWRTSASASPERTSTPRPSLRTALPPVPSFQSLLPLLLVSCHRRFTKFLKLIN